jgi:ketosteroid isomerase-like protein
VERAFGDLTVEVLGDVAVVASNDSGVVTPRDKAFPTITMRGRVINVFRRRVDGWRLARSINLMTLAKS